MLQFSGLFFPRSHWNLASILLESATPMKQALCMVIRLFHNRYCDYVRIVVYIHDIQISCLTAFFLVVGISWKGMGQNGESGGLKDGTKRYT